MKMNQKQIIESAAFSAGATVGAMGSRVVADKLTTTLKSGAVRHSLLGIVGIALVAFITPKDNATKFAQGAGVGIAATQLTDAIKALMTEDGKKPMQEGVMKTALGSPETEVVYVDSTPAIDNYDYYPYENVEGSATSTQPTAFLSAPSQFAEV